MLCVLYIFFFQAEDGIRDLVRSRGLGDVYKRQIPASEITRRKSSGPSKTIRSVPIKKDATGCWSSACLLYTSDAADERSSVDLGGRRIIKKKNKHTHTWERNDNTQQKS